MPSTTTAEELELTHGGGPPPAGGGSGNWGRGGEGPGMPHVVPVRAYYLGLSLGLVSIFMFFMALVSAYLVRKGMSDWRAIEVPRILWLNTAVLVASSVTIEHARKKLKAHDGLAFQRWWGVTTLLGLLFMAGQFAAWQQLRAAGVFLASNPASSFFYLLSGVHGLHLTGGVCALVYVAVRRNYRRLDRATSAEITSIYWHFMDLLWVFLLLLLFLGR